MREMDEIIAVLKATPGRWKDLAETIPDRLMRRLPMPGEWSALECLVHLIDTERDIFPVRVRAFLDGQEVLPAYFPDEQRTLLSPEHTAVGLAKQFEDLRRESLALLETVHPEHLACASRHAELGPVTLEQMLNEWAAHDLNHTVQAERALMAPFVEACGPWKIYF